MKASETRDECFDPLREIVVGIEALRLLDGHRCCKQAPVGVLQVAAFAIDHACQKLQACAFRELGIGGAVHSRTPLRSAAS